MSEQYQRCRFYPNCRIHMGDKPPRFFSEDNVAEMAELRTEGWPIEQVAEAFGTTANHVANMVRKYRERGSFG